MIDYINMKEGKLGMIIYTGQPNNSGGRGKMITTSKLPWAIETLSHKKGLRICSLVVEYVPSVPKALSSISSRKGKEKKS